MPDNVDRFVELAAREASEEAAGTEGRTALRLLPMEELITAFLPVLFPGMEMSSTTHFASLATLTSG